MNSKKIDEHEREKKLSEKGRIFSGDVNISILLYERHSLKETRELT